MTSDAPARQYARLRYRLLIVDLLGGLMALWLWYASGLSEAIALWCFAIIPSAAGQLAGYLAVFGAAWYCLFLPLRWYAGFVLEHRFGLSRMTAGQWAVRELKHTALAAAFWLGLLELFYALLRLAPQAWTVWATVGWVGVSVILARLFPTVLVPLFYKTVPLDDAALAERLLALCARVGVPALGAFKVALGAETRKANAALAGLGRTRRVLLSDTLLDRFTPDEIETVLAHELGHQHHRHITKFLALSSVGSWAAFTLIDAFSRRWVPALGLRGLSDLAGFPVLMLALSLLGLIGLPLQNAISRRFEWEADRFAVAVTQRPTIFADALRKLGELNLADPAPPRWVERLFYDHPSLPARIRAAETAT